MYEKFEEILAVYLEDLEEARNVSNKADALIVLKEHLINMNMYADYIKKTTDQVWKN
jgi:hypothetical protein